MKNIFFKIIDLICFVVGSFFFVGVLFSFSNFDTHNGRAGINWSTEQIITLASSAAIIVLGLLIRSWRKE
jgi:hypothetical protein